MKSKLALFLAMIFTLGITHPAWAASSTAYQNAVSAGERLKSVNSQFSQWIASGDMVAINSNYDSLSNQISSTERAIGKVSGSSNRKELLKKYVAPSKVSRERAIYEVSEYRLLGNMENLLLTENTSRLQGERGKLERLKKRAGEIKKAGGYASLPSKVYTTLTQWESAVINHKNPVENKVFKNEAEPNNGMMAANFADSGVIYQGLISESADEDWYKITTKSEGEIRITLEDSPGDYEFILYDKAGNFLNDSSNVSTTSEALTFNGEYPGDYFIKVFSYNHGSFSNQFKYKLKVSYSGDFKNTNDTIGNSFTVQNGQTYIDKIESITDVDWYTFTAQAAGDIRIVLDNLPADYKAILFDRFGNRLDYSNSSTDTSEYINYSALEPGTFYVKVQTDGRDYSKDNPYHLKVHYPSPNKFFYGLAEDNDIFQNAYSLLSNKSYSFKIEHANDLDWFKFQGKAGNIKLVLDQLPADYKMKLYDKFGNYIGESYSSSVRSQTLSESLQRTETYYLVVYPYGAFSQSSYQLRIFQ